MAPPTSRPTCSLHATSHGRPICWRALPTLPLNQIPRRCCHDQPREFDKPAPLWKTNAPRSFGGRGECLCWDWNTCLFGIGADHSVRSDQLHPEHALRGSRASRSEEHTSELQSLMRISSAVFCLNKKNSTYI